MQKGLYSSDILMHSTNQHNNTYNHSIKKVLLMLIILRWLKKLRQIQKLPSLKIMIDWELSITILLVKLPRKLIKRNIYYQFCFEKWP